MVRRGVEAFRASPVPLSVNWHYTRQSLTLEEDSALNHQDVTCKHGWPLLPMCQAVQLQVPVLLSHGEDLILLAADQGRHGGGASEPL